MFGHSGKYRKYSREEIEAELNYRINLKPGKPPPTPPCSFEIAEHAFNGLVYNGNLYRWELSASKKDPPPFDPKTETTYRVLNLRGEMYAAADTYDIAVEMGRRMVETNKGRKGPGNAEDFHGFYVQEIIKKIVHTERNQGKL